MLIICCSFFPFTFVGFSFVMMQNYHRRYCTSFAQNYAKPKTTHTQRTEQRKKLSEYTDLEKIYIHTHIHTQIAYHASNWIGFTLFTQKKAAQQQYILVQSAKGPNGTEWSILTLFSCFSIFHVHGTKKSILYVSSNAKRAQLMDE